MPGLYETSKALNSVACLKLGFKHCTSCMGYGGFPASARETIASGVKPCNKCQSTGLVEIPEWA